MQVLRILLVLLLLLRKKQGLMLSLIPLVHHGTGENVHGRVSFFHNYPLASRLQLSLGPGGDDLVLLQLLASLLKLLILNLLQGLLRESSCNV